MPPSSRPTLELSSWRVLISLFFLVAIITWFLFWPAFINVRDGWQAASWPTVTGVVEEAHEERNTRANRLLNQRFRFLYRYEVNDENYTGRRYSFAVPSGSRDKGVEQFRVGDACSVAHHPTDPRRCVIDASASIWWNYVILGFGMFGVVLLVQVGVVNPRINRRREAEPDV